MDDAIARARSAFQRRAWDDAYDAFVAANAEAPLAAPDVERWAWSAGLSGREEEGIAAFERLHQLRLDAGEILPAARAAFWAAMRLFSLGEPARGSGWLGRAQRLVEREGSDCVECGYLRLPMVFRLSANGDFVGARAAAAEAGEIGERHRDPDLRGLARLFEGRALIRQGLLSDGQQVLDEAMVDVTGGAISPIVSGLIYCGVIAACHQSHALDRAREWTAALSDWCQDQPQLVPFAGACLVHRSQILELAGAWPEALDEARKACARLIRTKDSEAGNAHYQEGELHRLRGELDAAERAYTSASERGRDPQPGLALLRLAQGRADAAAAASRRVLAATAHALERTQFLSAHVTIMLAIGDIAEARRAADELAVLAKRFGADMLGAMSDHAKGSVTLAEGDARAAIEPLRSAQRAWQRMGAPYLVARVRVEVARAFRALGDEDGAALEREAARKVFVELGAAPDMAAVEALAEAPGAKAAPPLDSHGLSVRELEVLRLVATGKTNKVVARELFISEKTVDRHVSNIFAKIDVSTRAAATAWAHKSGLAG